MELKMTTESLSKLIEFFRGLEIDKSFNQFLDFLQENDATFILDEYDLKIFQDPSLKSLECCSIACKIKHVDIRFYLVHNQVRLGIDYVGYWNKYYDCIINDIYFPMPGRSWASLRIQIEQMIADKSKGKNHYEKNSKIVKDRTSKPNKQYSMKK